MRGMTPWPYNFKGTALLLAITAGGWVVGLILEWLIGADGAGWIGLFIGSIIGWLATRGEQFASEAEIKRRQLAAPMEEGIRNMRAEAMRTQRAGTIGCIILYFAVFIGGIGGVVFFIWFSTR